MTTLDVGLSALRTSLSALRTAAQRGYDLYDRSSVMLKGFMPKGLYARALLIIIAPMVVLQSVVAFHVHKAALPCTTRKQPRNVRECQAQALACVAAEVATAPPGSRSGTDADRHDDISRAGNNGPVGDASDDAYASIMRTGSTPSPRSSPATGKDTRRAGDTLPPAQRSARGEPQ